MGQLPPEPPEPSTAGGDAGAPAVVFDLRVMSHEELAAAALATTGGQNPCGELLAEPPGGAGMRGLLAHCREFWHEPEPE